MTHLPYDHMPHSRIESTQIPKYNVKQSVRLTCATTRLSLYFTFQIQSRFSIPNVFRHDFTHLPCDHKPHSSIKSTHITTYNAERSV
ncbi:uncharacterized protein G2W53_015256 [Senna tora]|uniref:Uncharacterized protein n=1 Tax=Senna tora TaxID=362788 RepID=A0A834WV75_9FABA|nr:uncharacterized protein G2W53_015256 [Senna tora]